MNIINDTTSYVLNYPTYYVLNYSTPYVLNYTKLYVLNYTFYVLNYTTPFVLTTTHPIYYSTPQGTAAQVNYMCIEQTKVALTKGQSAQDLFIQQTNNGVSESARNIRSIL
jgi:hypothetical protein